MHEAPTTALLDDSIYHLDRAFMILGTYRKLGPDATFAAFFTEMKGYTDGPLGERLDLDDQKNFWENEFM